MISQKDTNLSYKATKTHRTHFSNHWLSLVNKLFIYELNICIKVDSFEIGRKLAGIALISSTIPWLKMNVKLLPSWVEANLMHFCGIPVVDILRFIALIKSWTRILRNEKRNDRLIYGLVLQRLIYNQLYTFLEKHNVLYKCQFQLAFERASQLNRVS